MGGHDEANVIVAVRVRPLSVEEHAQGEQETIYCPDKHHLLVCHAGQEKVFACDVVLGPESSQQDVFEECGVKRLIDLALDGFSCTIFAFGQTGSGKTHTITGPHFLFLESIQEPRMYGLVQRSVSYLLDQAQAVDGEFYFSASYVEIYNEQVMDLLNPWQTYALSVRGNKDSGFYVCNLSRVDFTCLEGFLKLLEEGTQNRRTSSHIQNEQSSRSHCILTVHIKAIMGDHGDASLGKLCIVDLAGSERVKVTGSSGELLEEASNINRSLLTLGKCISALVDPKKRNGHIPYRDSKLTKLLSDSLGGAGVTLMIACLSPRVANFHETMNTLRYSSRAKRIKNRPMAKRDLHEKLVVSLQKEINLLRRENMLLWRHVSSSGEETNAPLILGLPPRDCSEPPMSSDAYPLGEGSSCSDVSMRSFLQELMRENDRLQQDNVALLTSKESASQEREMLSLENKKLLHKLEEIESSPNGKGSRSSTSCGSILTLPHQHLPAVDLASCSLIAQNHRHEKVKASVSEQKVSGLYPSLQQKHQMESLPLLQHVHSVQLPHSSAGGQVAMKLKHKRHKASSVSSLSHQKKSQTDVIRNVTGPQEMANSDQNEGHIHVLPSAPPISLLLPQETDTMDKRRGKQK